MKIQEFNKLFKCKKPLIAMLHLAALPGEPGFTSLDSVVNKAVEDIRKLQKGGVNGLLIENWGEDSVSPFTTPETAKGMLEAVLRLRTFIKVPFGINVLNNDYRTAFEIASKTGASFVQLDVLVDHVISDFSYSLKASQNPFEIKVDIQDVQQTRVRFGLENLPLYTFIQPKHYRMLEPSKKIETSASEAIKAGVDGLIITKATGYTPTIELIQRVKNHVGVSMPVGIGSGFSRKNAALFLPIVDFAIVGTDLKIDRIIDNPVDEQSARQLMEIVSKFQ